MLLPLEFFLVGKLFAAANYAILRGDMRRIRSGRLRIGLCRSSTKSARNAADLQAGCKTFQIALLLVAEVDGDGFDFHVQGRSSDALGRTATFKLCASGQC